MILLLIVGPLHLNIHTSGLSNPTVSKTEISKQSTGALEFFCLYDRQTVICSVSTSWTAECRVTWTKSTRVSVGSNWTWTMNCADDRVVAWQCWRWRCCCCCDCDCCRGSAEWMLSMSFLNRRLSYLFLRPSLPTWACMYRVATVQSDRWSLGKTNSSRLFRDTATILHSRILKRVIFHSIGKKRK